MSEKFLNSLFNFLSKPINLGVLVAIFMTSLVLLGGQIFLPEEIIINLSLDSFYDQYIPVVLIIFFVSFFLLIVQLFSMGYKKIENTKAKRSLKEYHKKLFEDPDCWEILLKIYRQKNDPVYLPEHNQKVILLRQSGMIVRVTNQIIGYLEEFENPMFPYVLQTFAEKMVKEKLNE